MKNRSTGRLGRLFNVVIPECFYRGSQPLKNTTRFPNPAGRNPFGNDARRRYAGGFTLIELLVVVLIIGILSAIALPQYDKAVLKSRVTTGFAQLAALDQAQTAYHLANGTYATDVEALGSGVPQVGCKVNDNSSVVYCYRFASDSATKDRVRLEFYGRLYSGEKLWVCLAKKGDEAAQSICQSYYQQWRGTEPPHEGETGYTYYYGAPHS